MDLSKDTFAQLLEKEYHEAERGEEYNQSRQNLDRAKQWKLRKIVTGSADHVKFVI